MGLITRMTASPCSEEGTDGVFPGARPNRTSASRRNLMKREVHQRGRDAGNGQFIPVKVAERRSKTAIAETFKTDKNGRPVN
jgi:hypothetical protein